MSTIRDHKAAWAKHKARAIAKPSSSREATSGEDIPLPPGADREYAIALGALEQQLATLKSQYSDHDERNAHKAPLLNSVKQYLADWIASGKTHQNDVLIKATMLACDIGDWETAIDYTDVAVKHAMHSKMKRNLPTFVADAIRIAHAPLEKQAIAEKDAIQPFELPDAFYTVLDRIDSGDWAVEFIAQTKNQKMAGIAAESVDDWANAVKHYTLANRDETRGVKARLTKARDQLTVPEEDKAPPRQPSVDDSGAVSAPSPTPETNGG